MEIWLDTINTQLVSKAAELKLLRGVTTNPEILSKASNIKNTIKELLSIQDGSVAVQVTRDTTSDIVREAIELNTYSPRIVVKVPCSSEGYQAMVLLKERHIPFLATTVLHVKQALVSAMIGADYIAPYYSRLSEEGSDPFEFLQSIKKIYNNNNHRTKILAASLRSLDHLILCAELGIDAVTLKDDLFTQLIASHSTTEKWICHFSSTWEAAQPNTPLWTINQLS